MKINNMPAYAADYAFIVYTVCNDTAWFYGAYETEKRALEVADAIGGGVWTR